MSFLFIEGYVKQEGLKRELANIFHFGTGAFLLCAALGEDVWPGQRVYISDEDGKVYGLRDESSK